MRYELRCRECNQSWGNVPKSICEECFSPLEVFYDHDSIRHDFTREKIAQGPPNIWRYSSLLPLPQDFQPTLPVGFTPLIKAPRLSRQLGAKNLFLKNDAVCLPTLSFKDRVVAVALANARAFRFDTVSCSSTGNLATASARKSPTSTTGDSSTSISVPTMRKDRRHSDTKSRNNWAGACPTTSFAQWLADR